ncbi:MAG: outer membrane beta-barrel protein, partial [Pseudomonadota bacterium]
GPDTLVYGLAGYTWQNYSGGLTVNDDGGAQVLGGSYEFDTGGLTVGAGIENRIGNNMSVKLEYRYTDFDDVDIIPGFLGTDTVSHTVRLGLNYKFGMDGGAEPDMQAIAYDWTGFLIGIEAGLGANVTSFDINAGPLNADFTGLSGEGGTLGLRVGYDHQINDTWVVGAQFAGRLTNMDVEAQLNLGGFGAGAAIEEQYQYALTGRVGYLTTPDTMWYALAGYQWSSIDFNVLGATLGSIDREGFVVGAGVETALTENLSIGLEYRYVDYNDVDIIGAGVADALTSSHTGMLSLNYKFRP